MTRKDKARRGKGRGGRKARAARPAPEEDRKLLGGIRSPADLRKLNNDELSRLADEIRRTIIETVSRRGGHLASNLGVAELTIALHRVFDFTGDRLLWDVGHQCYAHKILTGRQRGFARLRQRDGVSGFPAPQESEYDLFATGHAGTAISTAAGLAWADGANERKVVAVVGDGAIVNGLSLEAMNNAGLLKRQFLVILNDNSMAIDVTRGAMAAMLDRIRMTHAYGELKQTAESVLRRLPLGEEITDALRHIRGGLRVTVHGEQLFESLGFRYFGPVDGHDIPLLVDVLRRVAELDSPVLLHVHTQKGRGCEYAVEDPCRFHSPSAHKVNGGVVEFPRRRRPSWTEVFGRALEARARRDERIVAITAAMPDGTGLVGFRDRLPERYIDVGISESHAVAMAAGLARGGLRPVAAIYSTFLQRGFDQVFEEVCLQGLPVIFCLDRAGLVGADGAVHHGFLDLAYLRALPGMVLMAPADERELNSALDLALRTDGPCAIRYPRDETPGPFPGSDAPFEAGRAQRLRDGADGTFLALGATVENAMLAADALARRDRAEVAVYSARFAKPVDGGLIAELIGAGGPLLTVEDHAVACGFGSAVLEAAAGAGLDASRVRTIGLPDRFIAHASRGQQLAEVGLDAAGLARAMRACLSPRGRYLPDRPAPAPDPAAGRAAR